MPLQLQGAPELTNFAAKGAGMWIEKARDLHGQGAPSGNHSARGEILPGGTQNGKGVNARMIPEPAIFVLDQRFKIAGRDLFDCDRIAPDPFTVGKAPERRALFVHNNPRGINLF